MTTKNNDSTGEMFDVLDGHGMFLGEVASRDECHSKGLWHKAVSLTILSEDKKKVLLQLRAKDRKLWPNLWDNTAGGHVDAGEWGYEAAVRETAEELGLNVEPREMIFIGATSSEDVGHGTINRHFNEYYILFRDVNIADIKLQDSEVADIKWFTVDDLRKRIQNNYEGLTRKGDYWQYLLRYLDSL